MKNTSPSQRCFDYLLDLMEPEERLRFEAQLAFDDQLAEELRACEADLADFAEAKATPLEPSPAVWKGIQERLEAMQAPESPRRFAVWAWGRWAWPLAACLLLTLNLWQLLHRGAEAPRSSPALARQESGAEEAGQRRSMTLAETETSMPELQSELEDLRQQVAVVSEELAAERAQQNAQGSVAQLRALRERREDLESRIENLENYYLTLAEMAGLAGGPTLASDTLESGLGVELTYSQNLLMGPAQGSVWDRMAEGLRDSSLVLLSVGGSAARGGLGNFTDRGAWTSMQPPMVDLFDTVPAIEEPYALAFVDKNSGQALLSLGSLPVVAVEEQLVLWARDSRGEGYRQIAPLPEEASGQSLNVGVRLPDGVDSLGELMITVEPLSPEGAAASQPSDRVVLQTVPAP